MTTLLIVDDNAEMRQLLKQIVRKLSDVIFECEDGDEVLTAYNIHRPDWVVMDVEMKRMDGLTATAALLALYPQAKVVVVTKYADANTKDAAMKAGAISFVGKDDLLRLRSILQ
jgi:CheY-like chemotaxis protein